MVPPVVKALFEDDGAFRGVSCGEDEYLGLSWSPIQACDGVRVWGLSKMMDMGLAERPKERMRVDLGFSGLDSDERPKFVKALGALGLPI